MCGIVGYIGHRDAFPIVIKGLKRLEYRGYDSAGIILETESGNLDEAARNLYALMHLLCRRAYMAQKECQMSLLRLCEYALDFLECLQLQLPFLRLHFR